MRTRTLKNLLIPNYLFTKQPLDVLAASGLSSAGDAGDVFAVVKMIQVVVMATEINRGRRREILEKQQHILVTVIIHNGKAVYYKNSILRCLFAALHHFLLYVRAC